MQPPRTRYPVVGQPSEAGFTPAELHNLAWPHWKFGFIAVDFLVFKSADITHHAFLLMVLPTLNQYLQPSIVYDTF